MNIVILGSTGSIGDSTLEVVRKSHGGIKILGLTAHRNLEKLEAQAREFGVKNYFLTNTPESESQLVDLVSKSEVATVVVAIVGFAALKPTLAALKAGKRVALANKEALVTCGELLMKTAKECGGQIIPVDSEHNALFQCLQGHPTDNVRKLWLTGSGGPFRGMKRDQLLHVDVRQALNHPKWKMGPKITIDSATLMNKGLEFIEARWVFDLRPTALDVIIHPQSIVHGLVEFIDGTMLAHLSVPDMKAAISYALYYPARQQNAVKTLSLIEIGRLDFEPVDYENFPCLKLAQEALDLGGVAPAVLNAANEVAVNSFLNERLSFLDISEVISKTVARAPRKDVSLQSIVDADAWARKQALEFI